MRISVIRKPAKKGERRFHVAAALLACLLAAAACSATDSETASTPPAATKAADVSPTSPAATSSANPEPAATKAADHGPPVPVLDIDSDMTWRQLLASIANASEMACIDDALGDELPGELLDITVIEPIGWPVVGSEFLGIEVGDDKWPHEMWRCLSSEAATAVYLSVFAQEKQLWAYPIGAGEMECIARLSEDTGLSTAVQATLTAEKSFEDGQLGSFMDEAGELAADLVFGCIPSLVEEALAVGLADALGDSLSEAEIDCIVAAAVDGANEAGLDIGSLLFDDTEGEGASELLDELVSSALETCLADS